ncbi:hypothetical protein D3C87_1738400 [compost metagenome]
MERQTVPDQAEFFQCAVNRFDLFFAIVRIHSQQQVIARQMINPFTGGQYLMQQRRQLLFETNTKLHAIVTAQQIQFADAQETQG